MKPKPKAYAGRVRQIEVPEDRDGQRLDNFLARQLKGLPHGALYRLIRTGQVRVDGGRARPDRKLSAGEVVRIPPVALQEPGSVRVSDEVCRRIEAAILYEDEDFLVVDKPSGIAVHGGSGLAWGLIDVVRQIRPKRSVELVHRIDRETSGVVVMACSGQALQELTRQFREGEVAKRYLCLMSGRLDEADVEVDAPITADRRDGEKQMRVDARGRSAVTRFHRLEQFSRGCLAEAEILTGRTHQIRVHAGHLGAPLAGDRKYGRESDNRYWRKMGLKRTFLHAAEIEVTSVSGERLKFTAPIPPELRRCLDALAGEGQGNL